MSEEKIIKCPFCDQGDIRTLHNPASKRKSLARTRGGTSPTLYTGESYEALEGCSKCGKSRDEIEKVLKGQEEVKPPSREDIIRRLREAGLPTKVKKQIGEEK